MQKICEYDKKIEDEMDKFCKENFTVIIKWRSKVLGFETWMTQVEYLSISYLSFLFTWIDFGIGCINCKNEFI